jgi:hypothetical protein
MLKDTCTNIIMPVGIINLSLESAIAQTAIVIRQIAKIIMQITIVITQVVSVITQVTNAII